MYNIQTRLMFMPLLHPFHFFMKNCLKASFSISLFILSFAKMSGQNVIPIQKTLEWASNLSSETEITPQKLFDNALIDQSGLPFFVYRQQLNTNASAYSYRFTTEEVTSFPKNLSNSLPESGIESDWKVITRVTDAAGIPYLIVKVLPIRKRNGQLEILKSFELQVDLGAPNRSGNRTLTFAENSVLAEGNWYKIAIARDGMYKLDKNTFDALGVDVDNLNPEQINIYGNGGSLLPTLNSVERPDDLTKNPVFFQGDGDQEFDANEFFVFYGKGPDSWRLQYNNTLGRKRWVQNKHFYSDSAYYFIRIDDTEPLRIETLPEVTEVANRTATSFPDYQYIENDLYNLAKSGREMYGDLFDTNLNATYNFNFPNVSSVNASVDINVASRSLGTASNFNFSAPGVTGTTTLSAVSDNVTSDVASDQLVVRNFTPASSTIPVTLTYVKSNADAKGWLDYITVNATRTLSMNGNQMIFRDTLSNGTSETVLFQLSNASTVQNIWDITNPLAPKKITFTTTGGVAEWKMTIAEAHEFIAFGGSGYFSPTPKGSVANQNLHAFSDIDLVIVAAPKHMGIAQSFADLHTSLGQTVVLTNVMDVFNEFSSGNPDVTAIRMLMKMLYDRAGGDENLMPQNLLLFGDGAYNRNKGIEDFSDYNLILFESDESLSVLGSYVSDDYFVFLSDDDDEQNENLLDCGVGRIPASNASQAETYFKKVRKYVSENPATDGGAYSEGDASLSPYGTWRNILTFVADDQDGSFGPTEDEHLNQSDRFARFLRTNYPEYDIQKIYMDAFQQVTTPGGERYPDGEDAIRRRIENGSLLVTYIGHGGERGWAHERILDIPTIQNFSNYNRLPVFLTATCELARYDDPGYFSAGEALLLNPSGGAIVMLTTTRIVFSGSNEEMDEAFFTYSFENGTISNLSLGKLNMLTKNNVSPTNNSKPNFSLLGDPAIRMVYPKHRIYNTAINGIDITTFTDTLKSLQEVEFTGYVGDENGVKLTDFNGFVYPTVYDKASVVNTLDNDGANNVQTYNTFNRILFKGKASVTNGDFSYRFVVPYDINYSVDSARVSYYAVAGSQDAHGYNESFKLGGSLSGAQLNTVGPEIELFMNDTTFVSGGVTNTEPLLLAYLRDENGINTSGNGIGHDITAIIDAETQNPIVLNEYYESDLDTYQRGSVRYQLNNISTGDHTLKVKAWDVHNNSSEKTIEFTVAENASIALQHVLNYPNPFTTSTEFFFEHNQAGQMLEVQIQIFTVGGKLVKTINQPMQQNGFRSAPIAWDGTDDYGDRIGKGVYIYRLKVQNELGGEAEQFEKLVILK